MKITIRNIDEPIEFSEEYVSTLEVRNKYLFREIISCLVRSQFEKYEYEIVNFDDGVALSDRLIIVSDVMSFDVSSRKIISEMYKRLTDMINNDVLKNMVEMETVLERIGAFAEDSLNFDVNYRTDFDLNDFLKLLKIEPSIASEYDIKQRVYGIIELINSLFNDKIICFMNLKQLITKEEFSEIVKTCLSKKQLVWFIESNKSFVDASEFIVVVDDDLYAYKQNG
jgi:CRISPR-associated protein, csn2 family